MITIKLVLDTIIQQVLKYHIFWLVVRAIDDNHKADRWFHPFMVIIKLVPVLWSGRWFQQQNYNHKATSGCNSVVGIAVPRQVWQVVPSIDDNHKSGRWFHPFMIIIKLLPVLWSGRWFQQQNDNHKATNGCNYSRGCTSFTHKGLRFKPLGLTPPAMGRRYHWFDKTNINVVWYIDGCKFQVV